MLAKNILNRILSVNSTDEFKSVMNMFKTSTAPQSVKDEAIRELKARKSCFCLDENITRASVIADIQAGKADTDDIGN